MNSDPVVDENFNKKSSISNVIVVVKACNDGRPIHEIEEIDISPIQHMCNKCNEKYDDRECLKRHLEVCGESDGTDYFPCDNNTSISQTSDDAPDENNPYEFKDDDDATPDNNPKNDDVEKCECCGEDKKTAHKAGMKCHMCNKYFKYRESYESHMQNYHSQHENALQCFKCNVKCLNTDIFLEHLRSHDSAKILCPCCKKEFTRKWHLKRHFMQTECGGQNRNSFTCQVCGSAFSRKDNLREHLRNHAGLVVKSHTCDYCKKSFRAKSTLVAHIKSHTGESPFKCSFCKKSHKTKGALSKHERSHTGEKPFSCDKCGRAFSAKETLNRHVKIHSDDKPHTCLECGKSFIQANQLRYHMFHHTGENGFKCKYCDGSFNTKSKLLVHQKYVHEDATKIKCTEEHCSKTFFTKGSLRKHLLTHTKEKPYKCQVCKKGFRTSSNLTVHMRTHSQETPRKCPHCPRAFIRADCLLRHTRNKHPDDYKTLVEITRKKKAERMRINLSRIIKENNQSFAKEGQTYISRKKCENFRLTTTKLIASIEKLMTLLVDESILSSFGWPQSSINKVLISVIKKCGCVPIQSMDGEHELRENMKLLLMAVIDNEDINKMINNSTVDEVIAYLLRLGKID